MGRKIEENKRKKKKRKRKILIAIEGNKENKTEKTYFMNFEDRDAPYNISFATGDDTDPENLVKRLIKMAKDEDISQQYGDKMYCIFDTDTDERKNKNIIKAKKLAEENGVEIITSTPSVELWFLLHFEYTSGIMNNKKLIEKLKKYCPKYTKSYNIYNEIKENTELAIERAKRLEKEHIKRNNTIGTTDANPNTEIYKVVEELMNKKD